MNLFAHAGINWPFGQLQPESFDLIMADPPWSFDNYSAKGERKNAKHHYRCLPTEEIMQFPVYDLATKNSLLWLWATNPMLPQALATMKRWGYEYRTGGSWVKTTKNGKIAFGTGYILRSASEPFLIGVRGKPRVEAKNIRSAIHGLAREHSRKPDEAFEAAERMLPLARRLELFSRTDRPGWETFGDEVGKFGVAV